MAKNEYISFITPLGRARYPKLDKQDVYEGKEVGYKCGIIFDEDDLATVEAAFDDAVKQLFPKGKRPKGTPLRQDKDGNPYVEFKSYQKVPLFAAKGNKKLPEDTRLGGGSTIRAKVSLTVGNGYLVGYLNAIQVAELVKGGDAGGFDDLEGFENPADEDGFGDVDDGGLDI